MVLNFERETMQFEARLSVVCFEIHCPRAQGVEMRSQS